ncbi:hypothetical protein TeGR_g15180 [Tetraparma gracilis]|uniref:Ceramidase n=1 Tax=Tetraparma gracilis TaxID=2962635 RepID=A0ABQ6NC07_9STRA|nr:hypothetical protein TeGR_g15180 [Tetraparma gracilis]
MAVTPFVVCLTLSSISLLTTSLYFFATPESLQARQTSRTDWGRWGPPTAEFNWCEPDYPPGFYFIAEPWNTFTSLLYCLSAFLAFRLNSSFLSRPLLLILLFISLIGIGSALFHGSLLYSTQLLDEIPMAYLVFAAAHLLYARGQPRPSATRALAPYLIAASAAAMTVLLWTADSGPLFTATRGFLTLSFTFCFIFIFSVGAKLSKEVREAGGSGEDVTFLFELAFWSFVLAILAWVLDIVCCPLLQSLPLGLPYPHLHALGWHLFSAFGLYFIFLTLAVHDCRVTRGQDVCIKYGWLPAIQRARRNVD